MSMTVAIRPALLWMYAIFADVMELDGSSLWSVYLTHDVTADFVGEFNQWISVAATSEEGPWQQARHLSAALTKGWSDAPSVAWGSVINTASGAFPAEGVFPPNLLWQHIDQKEVYALYHLPRQFCTRHSDVLRRAQILIDVDN